MMKADKSATITASAKAEQAFAYLAAFSGYGDPEVPDEQASEADQPLPAYA